MADSVNPVTPVTPEQPAMPANVVRPSGQPTTVVSDMDTPGMVMFAGTMLLLYGGFQFVWALVEFANAAWISSATYGTFGGYLWLWGILDIVFAGAAFFAGYSIFMGGRFGQVFGLIVAGVGAVRWFFYLPAAPWMGIIMIAVDVLIIYALIAHADYFSAQS
jgi:hypothetical protein